MFRVSLSWLVAALLGSAVGAVEARRTGACTLRKSVPEEQVAHHVHRFSDRSIAVELVNDGDGVDPFPEAQVSALVTLLRDIRQRRSILRVGVKRHSDLDLARLPCDRAQRRKVDPGPAFAFEAVLDGVFVAQ